MRKYTAAELQAMPTLSTGQADDLKVDTGTERVWLSRCTVADGEPYDHKVTVESLEQSETWGTNWVVEEEYPG
jgi:hypothetical protein